jgi:hypothetical protein
MQAPQEILVTEVGRFRDGGTTHYRTRLGIDLYEDNRIGSKTKGAIYDRYPNDKDAKLVNVKLIVIPKEISIKQ